MSSQLLLAQDLQDQLLQMDLLVSQQLLLALEM
jgi:hypothetical protein